MAETLFTVLTQMRDVDMTVCRLVMAVSSVACASRARTPEDLQDPTGGLELSGRPGMLVECAYMQGCADR
jgi:hypothetical protein